MFATKYLASKMPRLFAKSSNAKRGRQRARAALSVEQLEQRKLLAGLVIGASTFDVEQFATNIREQAGEDPVLGLADSTLNVVGFSYAVSQRDPLDPLGTLSYAEGARGVARAFWDTVQTPAPGIEFVSSHANKPQEVASVSKMITGTAMLHLMQQIALADVPSLSGQSLAVAVDLLLNDTTLADSLPSGWTTGSGFESVTLAQLLTHTSGIPSTDSAGNSINYRLSYAGLQGLVASNTVVQSPNTNSYDYLTTNFSFMRVMLPYLWDAIPNSVLDANADNNLLVLEDLPQDVSDFIVDDWNPPVFPFLGNNVAIITPDQLTASIYKYYVIENVLGPNAAGIPSPDTRPPAGGDHTLLYQFPTPFGLPGADTSNSSTPGNGGDQTLFAGARGWNLSARELEQFVTAFRYDDGILQPAVRQLMQDMDYGLINGGTGGAWGNYEHHNGNNFRPSASAANMNNTQVMIFPGGVQAALMMNSQLGSQFGSALNPSGVAQNETGALRDAYDSAWTHVVYGGDPTSPSGGDDVFTLRASSINPTNWIELDLNGNVVLQRRIDTLESLTIRGYSGDDQLIIQGLPGGTDLDLVFDGSSGDDSVTIGNLGPDVHINLEFNGTSGSDDATVNALAPGAELDFTFNGGLFDDTLTLNTLAAGGAINITFNGGKADDDVVINELAVGTQLNLGFNGGSGADMATINDLPATAAFTFSGGSGNDSVNVVGTTQGSIVTVHGGDDDDTVVLGTTGNLDHVRTTFLFVGGKGTDYLHVNDKINTSFEARQSSFDQQYIVRQNRIERSGIGVVGQFSQLEDVTLDASNETSLIRVLSTTNFTDLQLNGNGGSDRIVLGSGNASTQLNSVIHVDAAGGIDQLIIDDRFSQIPDEKYVLHGDLFQAQSIPLVEWGDSSPPEMIKLRQSQMSNETNIRNVLSGVRLDVQGNPGDDDIHVHATEPGSLLYVGGGDRDDRIFLGSDSRDIDAIRGVVRAFGGNGEDRVIVYDENNADSDGRNYRVVGYSVDVIGSTFGKLVIPSNSATERVEIHGGDEDDLFDVRTWNQTAELHVHAGMGDDELRVAAFTRSLDSIIGDLQYYADGPTLSNSISGSPDFDILVIHDEQRAGSPDYDIDVGPGLQARFITPGFDVTHFGTEEITLDANDTNNRVDVYGLPSVIHKADYILNVGGGKDKIYVQAPVSATVFGNGGEGNDSLILLGTAGDDEATLQGDRVDIRAVGTLPTTTVVRDDDILVMRVNSQSGNDVLIVDGQSGLQESILVASHGSPGNGRVVASPFRRVDFNNTEDIDVRGNQGDFDSLRFVGTAQNDTFAINPVGDGTTLQPFVQLQNDNGSTLLKLRDASNVGTPAIRGGGGSDTFRVSMFPTGAGYPIRDMRLDAGEDPGDTDHDQLIVNYNDSVFNLIQPPANQNDGTIRLSDGNDVLDIVFRDFEEVIGDLF